MASKSQPSRARRGAGRQAPRAKFDEAKHRRQHGRFADKPGAGNDAPRPVPRVLKSETALKTSGVEANDEIVLLSSRLRSYRGGMTVGDFADSHPKGRAYALRKMVADHKAGRIGFRGKPGPGEVGAQKVPAVGAAGQVKTRGVEGGDAIVPLSPGSGKYQGFPTVEAFAAAHPRGRAYALRVLAADHKAGRIEFRGSLVPAEPARPAAWSGEAQRRDLTGDDLMFSEQAVGQGLFKSEAEGRALTASLTAGVPPQEKLRIVWARGERPNSLVMIASNEKGSAKISRNFLREGDTWTVRHSFFQLPRKYRGGGNARAMLRSSVEAYDRIGVTRIETHANIDVGGYAWARLGFTADQPDVVRATIEKAIRRRPRSAEGVAARRVLDTASDDDLMFDLAAAQGADGARVGRKILGPKTDWFGHLDLRSPRHRERLNGSFG